jgi:hypothetical protein
LGIVSDSKLPGVLGNYMRIQISFAAAFGLMSPAFSLLTLVGGQAIY